MTAPTRIAVPALFTVPLPRTPLFGAKTLREAAEMAFGFAVADVSPAIRRCTAVHCTTVSIPLDADGLYVDVDGRVLAVADDTTPVPPDTFGYCRPVHVLVSAADADVVRALGILACPDLPYGSRLVFNTPI